MSCRRPGSAVRKQWRQKLFQREEQELNKEASDFQAHETKEESEWLNREIDDSHNPKHD